jgi:hypothetical protein
MPEGQQESFAEWYAKNQEKARKKHPLKPDQSLISKENGEPNNDQRITNNEK